MGYHARVNPTPLAPALDLDDTSWPIGPVIERAEQILHAWRVRHVPTGPDGEVRRARAAGLANASISNRPWPSPDSPPNVECRRLAALADRLAAPPRPETA